MVLSFRLFSDRTQGAAVAFAIGRVAHPCPALAFQGLASADLQRPECGPSYGGVLIRVRDQNALTQLPVSSSLEP
jgi:hypothetical protein